MAIPTFGLRAEENPNHVFGDTLHIYVNEDFRMMLVSENISRHEAPDTLNKVISAFNQDLMQFEIPDISNRFIRISYRAPQDGQSSITFKDISDADKTFIVLDDGISIKPMPIDLVLNLGKDTQLHLLVSGLDKLDDLVSYNIADLINKVIEKQKTETPEIRRVAMSMTWKIDEDQTPQSLNHYRNTEIGDQISLMGTAGAGLVRNRLVPSIDIIVGFSLANKTRIKHQILAEASMLYLFDERPEGGFNTDINTFVGASYFINTSSNPDEPYWFGAGLSYLAWRNGDFFDKNTLRLSLGAKFGKQYSIMPELYISDGFKKAMPGVKFRVWF